MEADETFQAFLVLIVLQSPLLNTRWHRTCYPRHQALVMQCCDLNLPRGIQYVHLYVLA